MIERSISTTTFRHYSNGIGSYNTNIKANTNNTNNTSTDNEVFARLRQKYLKDNDINYAPLDILLAAGLRDSCVESCRQQTGQSISSWSSIDMSAFSKCMQLLCSRTGIISPSFIVILLSLSISIEPTEYDPEWPKYINPSTRPPIRVDFILVSESFFNSSLDNSNNNHGQDELPAMYASVDINPKTNTMSDHYPIFISKKHEKIPLY